MPQSSPSVLIIRLDAIGDALALVPLLAALRAREIPADVVLRPVNAEALSSRAVRRVLVAPFEQRSTARANVAAIAAFGKELAGRYSHVLVATEDPGGYRLARATHAPVRVGFSNAGGKPLKSLWVRSFLTETIARSAGLDAKAPHECEVLFGLGRSLLGDATPSRDVAELRPLVIEREPERDARVLVQITDKWQRLGIDLASVAELVQRVAPFGAQFVASRAEGEYAALLASASGACVETLDTIEAWKERIAAAAAIVAPDSGAIHVAGMTGTPAVAVFAPQRSLALQTARWAPWAAPHRIVEAGAEWPRAAAGALEQLLA